MDARQPKKRTPVKIKRAWTRQDSASIDLTDVDSQRYCRMLAGERYIHDVRGLSIRELLKIPEFSHVSSVNAERWCRKDAWVEKRRALHEEMRNRVTKALITEMTQERIDHLRKLLSLRNAFDDVGMLVNDKGNIEFKLQPRSLESWMTAKVKLDEHISKIQTTVAAEIPQMTAEALVSTDRSSHLPLSLKPRLTEEESLDLALRLRDKRMHEDEEAVTRWKASQAQQALPAPTIIEAPKKKKPPPEGNQ